MNIMFGCAVLRAIERTDAELLAHMMNHPDIDGMREAIEKGDLQGMAERMENVLETVTVRKYPVIEKIKEAMKEEGALNALMSGSGPTVFGVFDEEGKAKAAFEKLKGTSLARDVFLSEWV